MSFRLIHNALSSVRPLALAGFLLSVLVLTAYAYNIEYLFRPISPGPATHPLTAVMLACLGLGVFLSRPHKYRLLASAFALLGLAIGLIRLLELSASIAILDAITPYGGLLTELASQGRPILMGGNTASFGGLLGIALLFGQFNRPLITQRLAYIAMLIPAVGMVGLAYGINQFYGQMALPTIVICGLLSVAVLLSTAHHGILRMILGPWMSGTLARLQIFQVCIVPFASGYFLLFVADTHPLDGMGLLVILMTLLSTLSIVVLTRYHERSDLLRRRYERHLAEAALYDVLTELPNRYYLLDKGKWLMQCFARTQDDLSVLMLDIDHFKDINDSFGHRMGDEALKHLAKLVRSELRQQDVLGRYGGEEFVILLPATSLTGAVQLAEKVRRAVAAAVFPHARRVTLSIGCAQVHLGETLEVAIERADDGMYQAKRGGRNQVVLSEEADTIGYAALCAK